VNPNRTPAGLLRLLMALLLVTGMAQAKPCLFEDDGRAQVFAGSPAAASVLADRAEDFPPAAQPATDPFDGFDHALLPVQAEPVLDRARLIGNGRTSYPTAPPSRRPCAAPSTGPPLV
jgi:hypothetical protein